MFVTQFKTSKHTESSKVAYSCLFKPLFYQFITPSVPGPHKADRPSVVSRLIYIYVEITQISFKGEFKRAVREILNGHIGNDLI